VINTTLTFDPRRLDSDTGASSEMGAG
jgi:hypothetical protein